MLLKCHLQFGLLQLLPCRFAFFFEIIFSEYIFEPLRSRVSYPSFKKNKIKSLYTRKVSSDSNGLNITHIC